MSESDRRNDNGKPEEPAYRVVDRRRVGREDSADQSGNETSAAVSSPGGGESGGVQDSNAPTGASSAVGSSQEPAPRPPPVEFSTFILSFASTAMIQLGAAPHPETGKTEASPELARETIDLLGMLREKTRGNLTEDESRLFDALLHDLRMKYVEITGGQNRK